MDISESNINGEYTAYATTMLSIATKLLRCLNSVLIKISQIR